MYLRSLTLENLRCYRHARFELPPGLTVILGANASGKTTLLEAVYLLATTTSPRATNARALIRHGESWGRVTGVFEREGRELTVSVLLGDPAGGRSGERTIEIDGRQLDGARAAIGRVQAVLFWVGELQVVKGSPGERRRFMNAAIGQVSARYLDDLARYRRALRQRNEVLKSMAARGGDGRTLAPWTHALVEAGAPITQDRAAFMAALAAEAAPLHARLGAGAEELVVRYEPSVPTDEGADIADLSGIEACPHIETLTLTAGTISDLTPLASLSAIRTLNLIENDIDDIEPLAALENLERVYLRGNAITSLEAFAALENLYDVRVNGNNVVDIGPLVANPGLAQGDSVYLRHNPLSQEAACLDIPALEQRGVIVDHNAVCTSVVVAFADAHLEALIRVRIQRPEKPVLDSMLAGLTDLDLSNAAIAELAGLQHLTALATLDLSRNAVRDITPLADLTELETLDLAANRVREIGALVNLQKLKRLNLAGNRIDAVGALAVLNTLEYLDLSDNAITSCSALVANAGLADGDTVDLRRNPLNKRALCVEIPALEARGVTLLHDGTCEQATPKPTGCHSAGGSITRPGGPAARSFGDALLYTGLGLAFMLAPRRRQSDAPQCLSG